ncbi:MAG: rhodanese-like domain-containing protein [Curvibacter sp.]|nr:rhodanese-like domain-containing protein [Curvibacter sp.]
MKFVIDNWMLFAIALSSGLMLLWPTLKGASAAGLTPAAAVQLINKEKAVVIDVSEADDYAKAHVSGARSAPLAQLETRLPELVKNKALPVIFVCASGSRAGPAIKVAQKLGYQQAQALGGGLKAWKEANLPIDKA